MRRNFLCVLAFALALAVQAVAPAAAARMAFGATSDSAACLTARAGASAAVTSPPAGPSHAAPELCDLCALCCGAGPLGAPRGAIVVAAIRGNVSFVWSVADDATTRSRRDHPVRARAPPAFS